MDSARAELVELPELAEQAVTMPDDVRPEAHRPTAPDATEHDDGAGGYEALDSLEAPDTRPGGIREGSADGDSWRAGEFDPETWAKVPEYGLEDRKTRGILATPDGSEEPLQSGYEGPSAELPKPRTGTGMNNHNVSHVEAHAAATMRLNGLGEGTLYINREPCPGQVGCDANLHRMLPRGGKLTVYGPDGFAKVYRGLPTEEG